LPFKKKLWKAAVCTSSTKLRHQRTLSHEKPFARIPNYWRFISTMEYRTPRPVAFWPRGVYTPGLLIYPGLTTWRNNNPRYLGDLRLHPRYWQICIKIRNCNIRGIPRVGVADPGSSAFSCFFDTWIRDG
jgi:hypothetical protein